MKTNRKIKLTEFHTGISISLFRNLIEFKGENAIIGYGTILYDNNQTFEIDLDEYKIMAETPVRARTAAYERQFDQMYLTVDSTISNDKKEALVTGWETMLKHIAKLQEEQPNNKIFEGLIIDHKS